MNSRRDALTEAHRQWRVSERLGLGWDWSQCLRYAHHKTSGKRNATVAQMAAIAAAIKSHETVFGPYGKGK